MVRLESGKVVTPFVRAQQLQVREGEEFILHRKPGDHEGSVTVIEKSKYDKFVDDFKKFKNAGGESGEFELPENLGV